MSESPQVKQYLISSITNYVNELPHVLPNDLRLRIFGNQEILEKCQMLVQTQPNAQPSFQKLNVNNNCQKTRKIRYYIFEVLPNFIVSFYFVPIFSPGLQQFNIWVNQISVSLNFSMPITFLVFSNTLCKISLSNIKIFFCSWSSIFFFNSQY